MTGEIRAKKTIELTAEELNALEAYRRIFPDISIMLEAGVFDFRGGSVIIHRDGDGKLQLIVPNWPVYRAPRLSTGSLRQI